MFSGLSKGTTRAAAYDQAARNIACLGWAVGTSRRPIEAFRSLGFWVLAPEAQIQAGVVACASPESVELRIRERIKQYEPEWRQQRLNPWMTDVLLPVLDRLHLSCIPWEQVLDDLQKADPEYGAAMQEFYALCVKFNRPALSPKAIAPPLEDPVGPGDTSSA